MDLDTWNALSSDERSQRQKRWLSRPPEGYRPSPEELEWHDLANEAEARFAARYGAHQDILLISSDYWLDDQTPVVILVRTRLASGQHLHDIPETFSSFPVIQEPRGDEIAAFNRTRAAILGRLFDWTDDTIQSFIDEDSEWQFRGSFFLHDPPSYCLPAVPLARSVVGPRDESELWKIGLELIEAIQGRRYVDQECPFGGRAKGDSWAAALGSAACVHGSGWRSANVERGRECEVSAGSR